MSGPAVALLDELVPLIYRARWLRLFVSGQVTSREEGRAGSRTRRTGVPGSRSQCRAATGSTCSPIPGRGRGASHRTGSGCGGSTRTGRGPPGRAAAGRHRLGHRSRVAAGRLSTLYPRRPRSARRPGCGSWPCRNGGCRGCCGRDCSRAYGRRATRSRSSSTPSSGSPCATPAARSQDHPWRAAGRDWPVTRRNRLARRYGRAEAGN